MITVFVISGKSEPTSSSSKLSSSASLPSLPSMEFQPSSMEAEPGSSSTQSKKGRSDPSGDHQRSLSPSHGVAINALPREIVVDILSRLPTPSLFRAQFVCRSWQALARDPLLVASSHHPSLVFHCDHPLRSQLYFVDDVCGVDRRDRWARKFQPPFSVVTPEFDVVGSSKGLLCLANALYSDDVYVYNPLTGEYRELPDSEAHQRNREMVWGFGFDETEKDYKVIKIAYRITNRNLRPYRVLLSNSEVQVCTLRSPTWRKLGKQSTRLPMVLIKNLTAWPPSLLRKRHCLSPFVCSWVITCTYVASQIPIKCLVFIG